MLIGSPRVRSPNWKFQTSPLQKSSRRPIFISVLPLQYNSELADDLSRFRTASDDGRRLKTVSSLEEPSSTRSRERCLNARIPLVSNEKRKQPEF